MSVEGCWQLDEKEQRWQKVASQYSARPGYWSYSPMRLRMTVLTGDYSFSSPLAFGHHQEKLKSPQKCLRYQGSWCSCVFRDSLLLQA